MAAVVDGLRRVDYRSNEVVGRRVLATLTVFSERMLGRNRLKDHECRAGIAVLREDVQRSFPHLSRQR